MTRLPLAHAALALAFISVSGGEVLADTCAPDQAFKAFVDAIRTNDVDLIDQLVLDSPDAVFFGTDGAERWVGHDAVLAAYGAQLAAFQTTRVDVRDEVVQPSPACDAAVFSSVWDWHISAGGQNVVLEAVRLTGALFRAGTTWHVAQFHFSMPVGGQAVAY
jgi:hypothetical protein